MPFANRRPPMGIADTAPITCPSPKQVVNGLGLSIQLSELHLLSETKGLKLPVLLKQSVSSYLCWILGYSKSLAFPAGVGCFMVLQRHCNELLKTFRNWKNIKAFKTYGDWLRDRLLYFENSFSWLTDLLGNSKSCGEFVIHEIMDDWYNIIGTFTDSCSIMLIQQNHKD